MEITLAQKQDAEQVYEVFKQTWLDTYINDEFGITEEDILSKYPEAERESKIKKYGEGYDEMNNDLDKANRIVWLAREDNKILGLVSITKGTPIELSALYVLPEAQGKGVGKRLIEFVLDYLGDQEITLNVASYNEKAIRFYEKYGFKLGEEVKDKAGELPSRKVIPEVKMIKEVK